MNKGFSADLNTEIYEFDIISKINFTPIKGQKTKSIYYKIIATMTENGCVFYVAKFADGVKNTAIKSSFIATANYSGKIYLLNKEEEIISAKKYFNGTFVGNIMVSDYKVNSYMWLDCTTIAITHYSTSYVEVGGQYFYTTRVTGTTYETICTGGGGDSGGGGYGDSGGGGSTDQYEVAVEDPNVNPCDQIKTQNNDQNYKARLDTLKDKTSLKTESGFDQKADGTYTTLVANGVKAITLPRDAQRKGFMHTHIKYCEMTNSYGELLEVPMIQMFSPEDVQQFLMLVVNAQTYGRPISDAYGVMVSSAGTYQLAFTGNVADINVQSGSINWGKSLNETYENYLSSNTEEGFLKFLKDIIGIDGIELYKVEDSGITKRTLDSNGKVVKINCN